MEIVPYVTSKRAAALLGVDQRKVQTWADSGQLRRCSIGETKIGPVLRISRESLRARMESMGIPVEVIDREPDLLTMKDVARLTGRSTTAVFEWIKSGLLPSVQTREGRIAGARRNKTYRKVTRAALDAFRERHAAKLEGRGRVCFPRASRPKVKAPSLFDGAFIRQKEAAKILGVSQTCLNQWVAKGLIPSEESPIPRRGRGAGPMRRIRRDDVQAFARDGVRPKIGRPRKDAAIAPAPPG